MESNYIEIPLNNSIKETVHNGKECDNETIYYGVYIPTEISITNRQLINNVYKDKLEAIKVVKKFKGARFKSFNYYPEAIEFSINGSECPNSNKTQGPFENTTYEEIYPNKRKTQKVEEKASQFRGPKSQELVAFRKLIEGGYLHTVKDMIWENPKYLVGSGDTPSILQEGCRYNALHIAAKAKNRKMCELILNTISNIHLIRLLYGDDNFQDINSRANKLLDLYLNTPDKALNETPLHFAVKFGDVDVVELLVSYPQCDKKLINKFGSSPKMLIGERCATTLSPTTRKKIEMLLDDTFYVPVLRSEGNCLPPVIGEPFIPSSPPNLNGSIMSPKMEIKAYAGPMDREEAKKFRRVWKTPPRTLSFNSSKLNNSFTEASPVLIKFQDLDKGLERVGRVLATEFDVGWKEYWPFLDKFINLSSEEGLQELENYLSKRQGEESDFNISDIVPLPDLETSFLSPISDLCKHFENIKLSESVEVKNDLNPLMYLEKGCQVFAQRFSNDIIDIIKSNNSASIASLQNQLKPLEQLILSFMGDDRFAKNDFSLIHSRLSVLINGKLRDAFKSLTGSDHTKKAFEDWLEESARLSDGLSSDDERNSLLKTPFCGTKKRSSRVKQFACIVKNMVVNWDSHDEISSSVNNEKDCLDAWNRAKRCSCVFTIKLKNRNRNRNCRNGDVVSDSNKRARLSNISVRLSKMFDSLSDDSSSSEDFYTPPSSPSILNEADDNDVFQDSICPQHSVFIEGNCPTKTDYAVFNAINVAVNRLDFQKYPNINKWFCIVSVHTQEERKSWSAVHRFSTDNSSTLQTSTPKFLRLSLDNTL